MTVKEEGEPITREEIYQKYEENQRAEEESFLTGEMNMKPEEIEAMRDEAKTLSEKDTEQPEETIETEEEETVETKEPEAETEVVEKDQKTQTEPEAETVDYLDVGEYGTKKLKTKVDGVEGEVSIADLLKSHQLEKHLTQKGQQLAEQQRMFQAQQQQFFQQMQMQQQQMQQPQPETEDQYLTEEKKRIKLVTQRQDLIEQQNRQMMQQFAGYNQLTQAHPDAVQLDQDPDFQQFIQTKVPMINKQFVDALGPQVLAPAMTLYKEQKWLTAMVTELEQSLLDANNKTASLNKERETWLDSHKKEQEANKRIAADIKPSTSIDPDDGKSKGDDEEAETQQQYVRRMKNERERAQGFRKQM